jgi:hypothetical protein
MCVAYILYVGHLSLSKGRDSLILAKSLPVHDCGVTRIQKCFACTGKCLRRHLECHLCAQILAVSRHLNIKFVLCHTMAPQKQLLYTHHHHLY